MGLEKIIAELSLSCRPSKGCPQINEKFLSDIIHY
jgi:hypothetical protein